MKEINIRESYHVKTQVLVVGGGPAGIAAAISAAREGAKVLLTEAEGCLGGMATVALVGPFMTCFDRAGKKQIIKGFYDELMYRLEKENGAIHPAKCEPYTGYSAYRVDGHSNVGPFNSDILKRVAEEMCLESGVEILYNTTLIDVKVENDEVKSAVFAIRGGIMTVDAEAVIDCTGNGDVAYLSGAPFEKSDDVQPASLFFTVDGVDKYAFEKLKAENPNVTREYNPLVYKELIDGLRKEGKYNIEKNKIALYESCDGTWRVNMTRVNGVDATDPFSVTKAITELRSQVPVVVDMLRKYIPACRNMRVINVANQAGFRESRRISGEYVLTAEEMVKSTVFEDNIALCANSFDMHRGDTVNYTLAPEKPYGIPYRSLIPRKIKNLVTAGRCISCTREALAAIRVMPPCFAMGQAAGVAAAIVIKDKCTFKNADVKKLQAILRNSGAILTPEDIE